MQGQLASAQSKTIEVTDSRPVAKAVEMLEEIYGLSITYEDPITIHESQLQDVTEQVQRIPDPSHRVIVQKDVSISFAYRPISSQSIAEDKTDQSQANTGMIVSDALSSVFAGYANAGGPVTFNVNEENGVFHVIPTNYLNKDGKIEQSTPILDTKITIDPKSRTRVQLLVEICGLLSKATGISIGYAQFPYKEGSIQAQAITTISGSNVTARSLLIQLMTEMDIQFNDKNSRNQWSTSWQLYYGPGWGYVLNFHHVVQKGK
jgi:hypothetical protein